MLNNNKLVSIIVPVYNAEKYLYKCIDSVQAQTYTNWELLLIDDGSEDISRNICEEYAAKDDRIIFIHKENSGVSDTRNIGIERCNGDNVCFVDADDWVMPKFLEHLMEFSEYDYVIAGYETWPENSRCILKEKKYSRETLSEFFDNYLQTRPTSCATLFNARIIKEHEVRFTPKLRSREDHLFNVQYMRWISTSAVINYQEYIVRSRQIPIAIKFKMHSTDIELVINSLLEGYDNIEKELGYQPKNLRHTLSVISQYYLEDFVRFNSDDDYFNLYRRYFTNTTKEDMYADVSISSMNLLIDGIIGYKQVGNTEKMQEYVELFARIFKNVSIEKCTFRREEYKKIALAALNLDYQRACKEINKVCHLNKLDDTVKKILRPLIYIFR